MHEMAIAHSILTEVEQLIEKHNARGALWVKIKIGILSGVVEEQLKFAFDIYKKQFEVCEKLELKMRSQPLILKCRKCEKITERSEYLMQCNHCHGSAVTIIDGEEMILEQVELELE